MTTTASRIPAVVGACITALQNDAALETLLGADKVKSHVRKGTVTPYVAVWGGDEIPWGESFIEAEDAQGRQCDVVVQCTSTYEGSAEVDDIASRVMEVLLENAAWSGVDGFQAVQFVRNSGVPPQDLAGDGVLWYLRIVTVRVTLP